MSTPTAVYQLGSVVELRGRKWLVVRICQSDALIEKDGRPFMLKEAYAELRDEGHDVEFIIFYSNELPTEPLNCNIRPLPRVDWKGIQTP